MKQKWDYKKLIEIIKNIISKEEIEYLPTTYMIKESASGAYAYMKRNRITLKELSKELEIPLKDDYMERKLKEENKVKQEWEADKKTIINLVRLKQIQESIEVDKEIDIKIKFNNQGREMFRRKHGTVANKTDTFFIMEHRGYKECYRYVDILTRDLVICR